MRYSSLSFITAVALIIPMVVQADPKAKVPPTCQNAEGQDNGLNFWPELEIPNNDVFRSPDYYHAYLVQKLDHVDVHFHISAFDMGKAGIKIANEGDNQIYRVNYKNRQGQKMKSFLYESNGDYCESPKNAVVVSEVQHITVEMLRFRS